MPHYLNPEQIKFCNFLFESTISQTIETLKRSSPQSRADQGCPGGEKRSLIPISGLGIVERVHFFWFLFVETRFEYGEAITWNRPLREELRRRVGLKQGFGPAAAFLK